VAYRSRTLRRVSNPPEIKGFKPYGMNPGKSKHPFINLLFEEYEALRLCDYDHYNHVEASELMGVSRPTFTRIYASALQKIAKAFVEGRQIFIEGGRVYFDSDWHSCPACHSYFTNPDKEKKALHCPLCGHDKTMSVDVEYSTGLDSSELFKETCVCVDCGHFVEIVNSEICIEKICFRCGGKMKRKVISVCAGHNCKS